MAGNGGVFIKANCVRFLKVYVCVLSAVLLNVKLLPETQLATDFNCTSCVYVIFMRFSSDFDNNYSICRQLGAIFD